MEFYCVYCPFYCRLEIIAYFVNPTVRAQGKIYIKLGQKNKK